MDIPKHFPVIAQELNEIERVARKEGIQLDQLTYEVTVAIWNAMAASDLQVLHWTFAEGKKTLSREIASKDDNESRGYGGYLFLLLIDEPMENWPVNSSRPGKYALLERLKALADRIKGENESKVSEMLRLRTGIFTLIDECIEVLELEKHKISLKGRCEYL